MLSGFFLMFLTNLEYERMYHPSLQQAFICSMSWLPSRTACQGAAPQAQLTALRKFNSAGMSYDLTVHVLRISSELQLLRLSPIFRHSCRSTAMLTACMAVG